VKPVDITPRYVAGIIRGKYQRRRFPQHDAWAAWLAWRILAIRRAPKRLSRADRLALTALRAVRRAVEARRLAFGAWTGEETLSLPPPPDEQALALLEDTYRDLAPERLLWRSKARALASALADALHRAGYKASFSNSGGPGVAVIVELLKEVGEQRTPEAVERALRGFRLATTDPLGAQK
jgi:hypothetical protein